MKSELPTAREYYRVRLVQLSGSKTMKKINAVVNIDKEVKILEEYAWLKVEEFKAKHRLKDDEKNETSS